MLPDADKRYAIETCRSSESVLKKWFKINDIQLVHLLVVWWLVKWICFAANRYQQPALVNTATNTAVPHSVGEFVEQLQSHPLLKNDSAPTTQRFNVTLLWTNSLKLRPIRGHYTHYSYHQFNIQQINVLPTQCIYVFCVDLRTNSDYFPMQH